MTRPACAVSHMVPVHPSCTRRAPVTHTATKMENDFSPLDFIHICNSDGITPFHHFILPSGEAALSQKHPMVLFCHPDGPQVFNISAYHGGPPWKWLEDGLQQVFKFWVAKFQEVSSFLEYQQYNYTSLECSTDSDEEQQLNSACHQCEMVKVCIDVCTPYTRETSYHTMDKTDKNYAGLLSFHLHLADQFQRLFPHVQLW